jgi:hypothetical protein
LNLTYLFQWKSRFFNVMSQFLQHPTSSWTQLCKVQLENSNTANKSKIGTLRFSKTGFSTLFSIDICPWCLRSYYGYPFERFRNLCTILWHGAFYYAICVHLYQLSVDFDGGKTSLEQIPEIATNFFVGPSSECGHFASAYPINGIRLTDSYVNSSMSPLLQVLILPKNKLSGWYKSYRLREQTYWTFIVLLIPGSELPPTVSIFSSYCYYGSTIIYRHQWTLSSIISIMFAQRHQNTLLLGGRRLCRGLTYADCRWRLWVSWKITHRRHKK